MALATQCPHCFTTFRVAADQLKLRGGIVRCGACQSIFDGNAHLVDLDKLVAEKAAGDAVPALTPAASPPIPSQVIPDVGADAAPESIPPALAPPESALPEPDAPAAPTHLWRSDAMRLTPAPLSAAAPYGPRERIEPSFGPPLANDLIAEPDSGFDREEVRLPDTARDDAVSTAAAPDETTPAAVVQPVADIEAAVDAAPDTRAELQADAVTDAEIEPHADADIITAAASDAEPEPEPEPEPDDMPPAAPLIVSSVEPAATMSAALPLRASAGSDVPLSPPVLGSKTARSKALDARTRRSKLTPTKIETTKLRVPPPDPDEPEFVKRSRRQERGTRTRRIAMGVGAAVLALGLVAQVVTEYRNVLAARYPAAKPVLGAACALLGCRVTLPAQVDNLAIDTGELTTLGPSTYALTTQLRNEGGLVQAWPSIELELIDADDKPVLRRVFGPADYLPPGALATAGFGPRTEQPVKLHFALADLKPAGYHTFVFYP